MSHFYGSIPISARKTVTTARGHKSTGIETRAASWAGAIQTRLWHDVGTGEDRFMVFQTQHHGAGVEEILAQGIVGERS